MKQNSTVCLLTMVSVGVKYILSIYVESSLPAIQELACQFLLVPLYR